MHENEICIQKGTLCRDTITDVSIYSQNWNIQLGTRHESTFRRRKCTKYKLHKPLHKTCVLSMHLEERMTFSVQTIVCQTYRVKHTNGNTQFAMMSAITLVRYNKLDYVIVMFVTFSLKWDYLGLIF